VLVAACNGGDDPEELADAIGDHLWNESQEAPGSLSPLPDLSQEDAACLGDMFVNVIGYETLIDAGVTLESVQNGDFEVAEMEIWMQDEETANAFVDGLTTCIDIAGSIAGGLAEDMGISEASAACIIDEMVDQDVFRDSLVASMMGSSVNPFEDPAAAAALFELATVCLTDEELASLMGG
jgi:hypothetical protein